MAQRLCFDERARVEAMSAEGVSVAVMAARLGRDPSTIHREIKRGGVGGSYRAEAAQAASDARAVRPKTPKLAADASLARAVTEGLKARRSPHALSAELRAEGHRICAETIYRACYDHTGAGGLPEGCWRLLPRALPTAQAQGPPQAKAQPAGRFQAHIATSSQRRGPPRGRALGGRLDHRRQQPVRGRDPRGAHQPPDPHSGTAPRLRRPQHRAGGQPRRWPASPATWSRP